MYSISSDDETTPSSVHVSDVDLPSPSRNSTRLATQRLAQRLASKHHSQHLPPRLATQHAKLFFLNNTSTSRPSTLSPTATLLAKGCVFPLLHFAPSSTASSDTGPKPPLHALHSLLHPFMPLGRQGTLTMSRNSTSLLQPAR